MTGAVARSYARAAFEVAREKHDLKGWQEDLDRLCATFADPEVREALANPALDTGRRIGFALAMAPDGVGPERLNFLKLLVLNRRTGILEEVRDEFAAMVDEAEGRVEVELTVPRPLEEADREALTQELSRKVGREVKVNFRLDPAILGGVVVRQGDHVVDGSVRRRLAEMREELLAG